MKHPLVQILKFLLFFGLGFLILYLLYRSQNANYIAECALKGIPEAECNLLDKLYQDFRNAKVQWIIAILLCFMVSNLARAQRWLMLLKALGVKANFFNAFFTIMLGYFANLGLPRMGEVIRAGVFARYEKIPTEKVLGTVVVDRGVDVLSLLFAILLAFLLQFGVIYQFIQENINDSPFLSQNFLFIVIAGILLLLVTWFFRQSILNWKVMQRFRHVFSGFAEGIRSVKTLKKKGWFVFHTAVIWLMYYLMTYLCFFAFEPTSGLSPLAGLIVFVFGGLGIVFPSPGGMGTYHAMIIAALAIYDIPGDEGFSFANILYFSVQLFCNISFGLLALILLPIINKNRKQPTDTDVSQQ